MAKHIHTARVCYMKNTFTVVRTYLKIAHNSRSIHFILQTLTKLMYEHNILYIFDNLCTCMFKHLDIYIHVHIIIIFMIFYKLLQPLYRYILYIHAYYTHRYIYMYIYIFYTSIQISFLCWQLVETLSFYHTVKRLGIPDSQIILMMAEVHLICRGWGWGMETKARMITRLVVGGWYMIYIWFIYGLYMDNLWFIYG